MPAAVTAESLFQTFFLPLYPAEARHDLGKARATDANPGRNASVLAHIEDAALTFERVAPRAFGVDLALDRSDASVHRLGAALTRPLRDAWMSHGLPGTADSELFNVVVHGAAYVGSCIVRRHGGIWGVRRPLWESVVTLESRAGKGDLTIFHWWLKSLADDALDDASLRTTLADRYRTHVEIPCARPEERPVLAEPRPIPRLAKVRYDSLHKHLRAHLPELRDLGAHFPSPERFDAYAFEWLDFVLLGGGRMLLVHGPGEGGVHAFWLTGEGFDKAVFFPADSFPAHMVRVEGDKLAFLVSTQGKTEVHEMLWWGP